MVGPRQQAKAASARGEQENSSAKANSIPPGAPSAVSLSCLSHASLSVSVFAYSFGSDIKVSLYRATVTAIDRLTMSRTALGRGQMLAYNLVQPEGASAADVSRALVLCKNRWRPEERERHADEDTLKQL